MSWASDAKMEIDCLRKHNARLVAALEDIVTSYNLSASQAVSREALSENTPEIRADALPGEMEALRARLAETERQRDAAIARAEAAESRSLPMPDAKLREALHNLWSLGFKYGRDYEAMDTLEAMRSQEWIDIQSLEDVGKTIDVLSGVPAREPTYSDMLDEARRVELMRPGAGSTTVDATSAASSATDVAREWVHTDGRGSPATRRVESLAALIREQREAGANSQAAQLYADGVDAGRDEEREECARVADSIIGNPSPDAWPNIRNAHSWNCACQRIAAAIRARGGETRT